MIFSQNAERVVFLCLKEYSDAQVTCHSVKNLNERNRQISGEFTMY